MEAIIDNKPNSAVPAVPSATETKAKEDSS